ncbi:GntR family transcriptional regulator [Halopseudomonas aestusnigri]|jgi:DNA-binding GntR family transcriptional regulator|uniref:GntR family transcriptional regulator n=1 Tax=Halopseudomonas TaxID=2901189 RepID=UPI000C38D3C5|nr:GntR family transcriptional regulator [Halopseudomonas aestusnigri]MAD27547.1 GntR family transcriptional regulator [Pseudomonadales bacterium]MDL2198900.1 GntR family transcriptional regulator [Halopseudomonas aestusnigri]MEE2799479.1 GntR family transcriptional regulator [Pseudomonadota bacterium]|tara:strand:- start:1778 stop:2533 length:756 start_codon:yes stop_codon:yes gene_type:complete
MTARRVASALRAADKRAVSRTPASGAGALRQDRIYQAISDAIIEHRLQPGARLREDALAEVFGVSRTGIRKVLQRLAMDQLITLTPGKGASVTRPSAEEAREVFDARRMVECGLMRQLAPQIDEAALAALRALAEQEQQALAARDQSAAIKCSAEFHSQLAVLAGNQTLASFVVQLCSRSSLILAVYGNAGNLGCDCTDHDRLITLLEGRDGEAAAAFMAQHLDAIEGSLAIADSPQTTPDLQDIFAAYRG